MVETIVLIAIPAIAIVVTSVVIMWNEFKTQKLQEAMFEEYKRCQLYGGDENDKLRELVLTGYDYDPMYAEVITERDKLRNENTKLREFARDMFEEIEAYGFDPYVERQGKRGSYYEEDPSWRVKIRKRVRELGIEVEDA